MALGKDEFGGITGSIVRRWDDDGSYGPAQTYYEFDELTGEMTLSRPYNADDIAAANQRSADATAASNRQKIVATLNTNLDDINTLLNTDNATINTNPAPYIKALARIVRRLIRLAIYKLDVAD